MAITHLVNLEANDSLETVIRKCNRNFFLVRNASTAETRTIVESSGGGGGGGSAGSAIVDLANRLSSLARTVSGIQSGLDVVGGKVSSNSTEIGKIKVELSDMAVSIGDIEDDMTGLAGDMATLDAEVTKLKEAMDGITGDVLADVMVSLYPIGAVVISTSDPATSIGSGTWEQGDEVSSFSTEVDDGTGTMVPMKAYAWLRTS